MLGDHLAADRGLYKHHGVDVGSGWVVNYGGATGRAKSEVRLVTSAEFASGSTVRIVDDGSGRLSVSETVHRARGRLGEDAYHLMSSNCEHLALWSTTGYHQSGQVAGPRWLHHHLSPLNPFYMLLYGIPVGIQWVRRQEALDARRLCPECSMIHGWKEAGGIDFGEGEEESAHA